MNIGMLWFDNSKKPLSEKIEGAKDFYFKKYGRTPTKFFVSLKAEIDPGCNGLNVEKSRSVLPNHIWVGMEYKNG